MPARASPKERRLIDEWMVGAQPCWKLAYTGSVGSQTLTGNPGRARVCATIRAGQMVRESGRSRPASRLAARSADRVCRGLAVVVENEIRPEYGPPHDKAQVRTVAEIFAARDRAGELAGWFAGAPTRRAPAVELEPRRPGPSG